MKPLATSANGSAIVEFLSNVPPISPDPQIPLTFSCVSVKYGELNVILYNAEREQWETPGGGIETGETIADCARREVFEEVGQRVVTLTYRGLFLFWQADGQRFEYGALFAATIDELLPFTPNEESSAIALWNLEDTLEGKIGEFTRVWIQLAE